ncbi:MAG: hypothetical protein ACI30K_01055 [Muribaculaceae bacterium]
MENKGNKLWSVDKELFATMRCTSTTPEELNFFQNMKFKEEYELTLSNDLIMSERDNADGIYIVRVEYDEYIVGCTTHPEDEVHTMNLYDALNIKLHQIGIKDKNVTIWEWLRSINYQGISYNHNYDNM